MVQYLSRFHFAARISSSMPDYMKDLKGRLDRAGFGVVPGMSLVCRTEGQAAGLVVVVSVGNEKPMIKLFRIHMR